jgi:Exopolysaccharide biosynthesis protein YbjH/Capsule biosynthesis GfcC
MTFGGAVTARWGGLAQGVCAWALATTALGAAALPLSGTGPAGQRLSEAWMLAIPTLTAASAAGPSAVPSEPTPTPYPLGLMWLHAASRPAQTAQRQQLLDQLQSQTDAGRLAAGPTQSLMAVLRAMPVTGRVALLSDDPVWLQANPHADPVLGAADQWWLPARPSVVQVVQADGQRCELPFVPSATAAAYLARCPLSGVVDTAWLIQPNGRVERVGVAPHNASQQAFPAPGARLWAPHQQSGWGVDLSQTLALWLATQAPAGTPPLHVTGDPAPANGAAALAAVPANAALLAPHPVQRAPRDLPLSAGDWGVTGLMQTASARTRAAGSVVLGISRTAPYTQYNAVLSPFDKLELAVRYSGLSNTLYGAEIAGDQSYKDKSAEIKWRLLDESAWSPAVALGLRDPGGTGLFAGEYVVASKRWADWDFSLGLGWGYLGARGSWRNPLGLLAKRFDARGAADVGNGGTAHWGVLFSGRVAPFGGVQWHSPWQPLVLKLELDGNDYQQEPFGQRFKARSPLNLAAVYSRHGATLSLGVQRGNQLAVNLSWQGSVATAATPKLSLPRAVAVERTEPAPPVPVAAALAPDQRNARLDGVLQELSQHSGWQAVALTTNADTLTAQFDGAAGHYVPERLQRVWAVLHREAPDTVQVLRVVLFNRQLPLVQHSVQRWAWARAQTQALPPLQAQMANASPRTEPGAQAGVEAALPAAALRQWDARVNLGYQQTLGGPDGYLYALSARAFGHARLWPGAWVQGTVQARLLDNYDRFNYTAPSDLPRVRTQIRDYVTNNRVTVPNLQFTHAQRLGLFGEGLYAQVYAGLLEPMFAGAGAELLWRPLDGRLALGLDINQVRQRSFDQRLGLLPYRVKTGHLSLYWDTGWKDVMAELSGGQYLAGDRGATVDLSRAFKNGARIGAWFTKTNVSAQRFGEGSFDKGVYVSLPFDAFFTSWSAQSLSAAWQPLIRDGGARLQRSSTLWGLTQLRDGRVASTEQPVPVPRWEP